ncbi:MAG TPA: hypothetical protein VMI56_20770 [Reyranella sp.]|nr:hypothetical protein [Reyranella sp.]
MKAGFVAAGAVIATIALGAAAVPLVERYVASEIKVNMERDGQLTVREVSVGLFSRRLTLSDLRSKRAGDFSAARWEASGLAWPLGELLEGRTPFGNLQLGDPLHADHLEVEDAKISDAVRGITWNIGALKIDGLDVARYDANVGDPYASVVVSARAVAATTARHLDMRNIFAAGPTGDTFGFGAISAEGIDHGKIASVTATSLEVAPQKAGQPAFKIDEMRFKNLDLAKNLAILTAGTWRPGAPIGQLDLGEGIFQGFSGDVFTRYGLRLGKVSTETVHDNAQVSHSRTRIEGFAFAPPANQLELLKFRLTLLAMGLQELKLDFDCSGDIDRGKGELTVSRCALTGPELGVLSLDAKYIQADDAFWRAIQGGDFLQIYRSKVALASAKLALADKGLLTRGMRALGTMTGQSEAATRAKIAEQVRRFQPAGLLITDDLTKLLETVARFVEKGGTLSLDAKPEPPLGMDKLGILARPGPDLVSLLGLTATLSR